MESAPSDAVQTKPKFPPKPSKKPVPAKKSAVELVDSQPEEAVLIRYVDSCYLAPASKGAEQISSTKWLKPSAAVKIAFSAATTPTPASLARVERIAAAPSAPTPKRKPKPATFAVSLSKSESKVLYAFALPNKLFVSPDIFGYSEFRDVVWRFMGPAITALESLISTPTPDTISQLTKQAGSPAAGAGGSESKSISSVESQRSAKDGAV